ncbi:translationally-controlled tumor protein [Streptomyces sp. NPDC007818]|uniref:translationally-controlled tumor protein n=1 Tax=Streptomyces sp. NPDC007818 TaxID=3364780 RepID=UPI00367E4A94
MKVYKDVFSGDEMLSDAYPIKEDGICYVVEGKCVTRPRLGGIDLGDVDHGGNDDDSDLTVVNVVDAHRLVETSYDRKSYAGQMKAYLKRVSEKVALTGDPTAWRQQAQEWAATVLADFDSYRFYTGEQMDSEAMVVLMKMGEDGKTPFLYYIREGLKEEVY